MDGLASGCFNMAISKHDYFLLIGYGYRETFGKKNETRLKSKVSAWKVVQKNFV